MIGFLYINAIAFVTRRELMKAVTVIVLEVARPSVLRMASCSTDSSDAVSFRGVQYIELAEVVN